MFFDVVTKQDIANMSLTIFDLHTLYWLADEELDRACRRFVIIPEA